MKSADMGSIPGLRKSSGGGHDNPLQYSCLENLMDREAWWATVHGVAKSQTLLTDSTTTGLRKPLLLGETWGLITLGL